MSRVREHAPCSANDNADAAKSSVLLNPRIIWERLGFPREDLTDILGISLDELLLLESGHGRMSLVVSLAMEALSLQTAVTRGEPGLAHPGIRRDALDFTRLIDGVRRS